MTHQLIFGWVAVSFIALGTLAAQEQNHKWTLREVETALDSAIVCLKDYESQRQSKPTSGDDAMDQSEQRTQEALSQCSNILAVRRDTVLAKKYLWYHAHAIVVGSVSESLDFNLMGTFLRNPEFMLDEIATFPQESRDPLVSSILMNMAARKIGDSLVAKYQPRLEALGSSSWYRDHSHW